MLGEIIGILADRGRHSREAENSSIAMDDDIFPQIDVWSGIIAEAEDSGFSVEIAGNYINFRKGRNHGSFTANSGGASMAREFLRGEA